MKRVLVFLIFGILLMSFIGIVVADNDGGFVERPVEKSTNTIQDDNNSDNEINDDETEVEDDSEDNETEDDDENEIECEDYRYSTCPEGCLKRCVSSSNCPANDTGCIGTTDCEGKGSCYEKKDKELRKRIRNMTKDEIKEIVREKNRIKFEQRTGVECPEDCKCTGVTVKCQLEDGGREMTIYSRSGNIIIQVKNINATTQATLYHYNKTTYGIFEGNKTKEIILPDKIKDKVREKIRARIENQNITLDENGFYQVQGQKRARFFLLFPVREKVQLQLDAENGAVVKIRNPWWGFLARDVEEN